VCNNCRPRMGELYQKQVNQIPLLSCRPPHPTSAPGYQRIRNASSLLSALDTVPALSGFSAPGPLQAVLCTDI
jgi:hypothetical protein